MNNSESFRVLAYICFCGAMRSASVWVPGVGHVFASRLCHSGQTHRLRRCSVTAVGAFEYPKTGSTNGNKELYF